MARNSRLLPLSRVGVVVSGIALLILALAISGCSIGPLSIGDNATPVAGAVTEGGGTTQASNASPTSPPATPTPQTRSITGKVTDVYTGQPVSSAEITAAGILTETTGDGSFSFDSLPLTFTMTVAADGYALTNVDPKDSNNLSIKLRPNTLSGRVTSAADGKPLANVLVKLVMPVAAPAEPVTATATLTGSSGVTDTTVPAASTPTTQTFSLGKGLAAPVAQADASATKTSDSSGSSSRAATPTATEILHTNTPAPPTATPTPKLIPPTGDGFVAVYTDADGNYFFKDVPEGASLTFKMPGYKLTKMPVSEGAKKDVALEEFKAEGIYITANVAASSDLFDPLIDWAATTRINTVVLNVQDDASAWVFDVQNPDVIKADNTDIFLKHMPDIVKKLKDKGFYVIARIVTFQQKTMAEARPDWAVKSSTTGKPWKGGYTAQQRWLDASNPAAQDHIVEMTKEVLGLGFDEIQYDYVRFPSDPAPSETGDMVFAGGTLTDTGKVLALQQFFKKAYDVINPTDAFMSADVFGYTLWPDKEDGPILGVIGQVPQYLLPYTDYLSPMIYPSHFSPGEQGCAKPAQCAYSLVHQSGVYAKDIFAGQRAKYRPWLQDFDWPGADYTSPGTTKVADQVRAATETNAWGWLWWDASNQYEPRAAFEK